MSRFKYQNWYEQKRINEAKNLYNKLVFEAVETAPMDISPEIKRKAKMVADDLSVDYGRLEGKQLLQKYEKLIKKIEQNGGNLEMMDFVKAVVQYLVYAYEETKSLGKEFSLSRIKSGAVSKDVSKAAELYGRENYAPLGSFAKQAYGDVKKKVSSLFKEDKQSLDEGAQAGGMGAFAGAAAKVLAALGGAVQLYIAWKIAQPVAIVSDMSVEALRDIEPDFRGTVKDLGQTARNVSGIAKDVSQSGKDITGTLGQKVGEFTQDVQRSGEESRRQEVLKRTQVKAGESCDDFISRIMESSEARMIKTYDPNTNYKFGDIFDCRDGSCLDEKQNPLPQRVFRVIQPGNAQTGAVRAIGCR